MSMKKKQRHTDPHAKRESENYANPLPSREFILATMTQQGVPLSVAPAAGLVKVATRPVVGAGLETVTAREAPPVLPAESVTLTLSVCEALVTVVVFQVNVLLVPLYTVTPSTASL